MNQLQQFMYGHQEVRSTVIDGQPWFVAKDVCDVLELTNSRMAIDRLDEDEKGVSSTDTLGGKQSLAIINEPGLYSLILGSRKPEAKQFKRWITHDVIPSIRKTGGYMIPQTMPETLRLLAAEIEKNQAIEAENERLALQASTLELKVEQDKPKTIFADAVSTSNDSILVGQLATILKQNGVNIGQTRLFNFLREEGYLCKSGERRNLPTQKAMELKLFEVKEFTVHGNSGIRVKNTPKVTGRGQIYFINKFLKHSA
ncbi:phage antirepressor [Paenibacillus sp. FSL L8-0493]|uniref:phage antirepressor n=1 Tax=Paenibacillus sp. FSL L8-0493 TaxID=2975333 RepID=UPI0030FD31E9